MHLKFTCRQWQVLRKRKRELLEEEDSDVEPMDSDEESDLDVTGISWGLGDGGPQGVLCF